MKKNMEKKKKKKKHSLFLIMFSFLLIFNKREKITFIYFKLCLAIKDKNSFFYYFTYKM